MQSKTILATACLLAVHCLAQAQQNSRSSETDILTIYKGAHTYKEVSVAGKTTEVYVDDDKVADNDVRHFDSLIQVMRKDVAGSDDGRDEKFEHVHEQMERNQEQVERQQEQAERQQQQFERQQERAERDQERLQNERDRQQAQREREQGERDRAQGERDRAQGEIDRQRAQEDRAQMRHILQYLVDRKIVAHPEDVTGLVLNDSALYVNGNKQPNEIYQTLKDKYADWAHYGFSYGDSQAPNTYIHMDIFSDCCR